MADVTLLGLGPVGLATAWDLLRRDHSVVGYDPNRILVAEMLEGNFSRVGDIAHDLTGFLGNKLQLRSSLSSADVFDSVIICVGTPASGGGFDVSGVREALKLAMAEKGVGRKRHFVIRSTLLPGTTERELLPLLGGGEEFDLSYFPEFLREKRIREDADDPPLRVASHSSPGAADRFHRLFPGGVQSMSSFSAAEALKIVCNAYHALKVAFANEVAGFCSCSGASGSEVMDFFRKDRKLNISDLYLLPGEPFAGPCLEKDLTALEGALREMDISCPLLGSIRESNLEHGRRTLGKKHAHA